MKRRNENALLNFFRKLNWRRLLVIVSFIIVISVGKFTKGIDIAGGVEFVYKIDFSKYKELYSTTAELTTAKQQAKQIIEANIRKRVNALWVGDAEVKLQTAGADDYVVVRIWGLDDLDKAREIIWKTVELEFALPNPLIGSGNKEAREKLANELLAQIIKNPDELKIVGDQGSNDVFYLPLTNSSKNQLPPALSSSTAEIGKLVSGEVLNYLIKGNFQPADPSVSGSTDVNGFFIVKSLGKSSGQVTQLSDQELSTKATALGYTVEDLFSQTQTSPKGNLISTGVFYDTATKVINFDLGDPFPNQIAYKLDLYVPGETEVKDLSGINFDSDLESLGLMKYVDKKWATYTQLPILQELTGLDANNVKLISTGGQILVIKIYEVKQPTSPIYRNIVINGVPDTAKATAFIQDVVANDIYNLDVVFIRDTNAWIPAQDTEKRVLNGAYFKFASVTRDQVGRPSVQINLDEVGKDIFCKITESNLQNQMAIFVGGVLVTAPVIQAKICDGSAIINGDYDVEGAKKLSDDLNAWALPAKLIQINESKVSATLGEDAWKGALWSTVLALILISALMTWRYGIRKAIISLIALLSFIIVLIALLKLMGYALSLSGMAAIILNIGMWIDAAILIYERLHEELKRGSRYDEAVYTAYDRAWPAVFGGQISTFSIWLLLLLLGSDLFQGFGLTMTLNIIILLLVSVPLIKVMLLKFGSSKEISKE
jgi:protein-export membrane protein SecD